MSDFERAYQRITGGIVDTRLQAYCEDIWQAAKQSMQGEAVAWRITVFHKDGSVNGKPYFSHDKIYSDCTLSMLQDDGYESVRDELYTHAPDSAARIAEQDAEIARLQKELEEARKDADEQAHLFCAAVEKIINGKDDGAGLNHEPWATTRVRLLFMLQNQSNMIVRDGRYRFHGIQEYSDTVCEAIDASINIKGGAE